MPNKPYLEISDGSTGGSNLKIDRQNDTYPGPFCCLFRQKNNRTLVYVDYYPYLCTTKGKCPEPEKYRQYFIQGHRESARNSGLPLCGYGLFGDDPSGCTGGSPLLLTRSESVPTGCKGQPKNARQMKRLLFFTLLLSATSILEAQTPAGISYDKARTAPAMRWACPDIEKYQRILYSSRNDDYKVYANNVMDRIELYVSQSSPADRYLCTQAVLTVENPLFNTENLLNHISTWMRKTKGWKKADVDIQNRKITSSPSFHVADHATLINVNKIHVNPAFSIELLDDNNLLVLFMADTWKNDEYDNKGRRLERTFRPRISEVFPFNPKSSYKNCYAKAFVASYQVFWDFINDLRKELNTNYTRDERFLAQLHYGYSKDSLMAKYGQPTKVIADQTTSPDIHKEMYVFEDAQKIVFMDKTIDFRDVISCEIVDDPKFIPGRTTTYGAGFSIFGIGLGGTESYTTPDKTIHSYVVKVKIDNLGTPLIYIATGQNEQKAEEIASVFEYIMRHQQSPKGTGTQNPRTVTKRTK